MKRREWINWAASVIGLALIVFEMRVAPLLFGATLVIVAIAALSSMSTDQAYASRRYSVGVRGLSIGSLLAEGLWIGTYFVLRFADSGTDSTIPSTFPVRFDGEEMAASGLLVHGTVSTIAIFALLAPLRLTRERGARHSRRKRQPAETTKAEPH